MREIKFRAYNKHRGMMEVDAPTIAIMGHYNFAYAHGLHCSFDEEHGAYSTWGGSAGDERAVIDGAKGKCILMQFTGLLDKNGKEIYEGDIVKYVRYPTGMRGDGIPSPEVISQVKWSGSIPGFVWDGYYVGEECAPADKVEVIGNIYQNPELLN